MINQEAEGMTKLEEVVAAIERSKNLVSINEAEALRLQALALSYQYTVNEVHKQKIDLDEQIVVLEEKKGKLDADLAGKKALLEEIRLGIDSSSVTLADLTKKAEAMSLDTREKLSSIASREAALLALKDSLDKRAVAIEATEKEVADKLSKVKSFSESL